jgi:hypothetical protein
LTSGTNRAAAVDAVSVSPSPKRRGQRLRQSGLRFGDSSRSLLRPRDRPDLLARLIARKQNARIVCLQAHPGASPEVSGPFSALWSRGSRPAAASRGNPVSTLESDARCGVIATPALAVFRQNSDDRLLSTATSGGCAGSVITGPNDTARLAARFIRAECTPDIVTWSGRLLPDGAPGVPSPFAALLPRRVKTCFHLFGPTCLFATAPHRSFFADGPPECLSAATRRMRWAARVAVGDVDGLLGFAPVCGPCLTVSPRWTASALGFASCRVLDV